MVSRLGILGQTRRPGDGDYFPAKGCYRGSLFSFIIFNSSFMLSYDAQLVPALIFSRAS